MPNELLSERPSGAPSHAPSGLGLGLVQLPVVGMVHHHAPWGHLVGCGVGGLATKQGRGMGAGTAPAANPGQGLWASLAALPLQARGKGWPVGAHCAPCCHPAPIPTPTPHGWGHFGPSPQFGSLGTVACVGCSTWAHGWGHWCNTQKQWQPEAANGNAWGAMAPLSSLHGKHAGQCASPEG